MQLFSHLLFIKFKKKKIIFSLNKTVIKLNKRTRQTLYLIQNDVSMTISQPQFTKLLKTIT